MKPCVLALALLLAACGDDEGSRTTLDVFAASSLTEAFTAMAGDFERDHPGVEVSFSFAGSSALAQQVNDGAPADVFVSADEANMARVTDVGNAADPRTIARNRLTIVVERGNPEDISGLADLADPELVLVVCAPEVPCGTLAEAALDKAGVDARPDTLAENVKAVVSRVVLGEADAGIVYVTDVRAAGDDVEGVAIDIAADPDLEAVFPAAVTTQADDEETARRWVDHLLSDEGQEVLVGFGFLEP